MGGRPLPGDRKALQTLLNKYLCDKAMVVEIGSWTGGSASVIAKETRVRGGILYCVDHWKGGEGEEASTEAAKVLDIYNVFKHNMEKLGLWDIIRPIVSDSETASKLVSDKILDFVYIDANHSYEV